MTASQRARALSLAVAAPAFLAGSLATPRGSRAFAGTCSELPSASPCINADAAWPHAGGGHFLFVGGTETVDTGHVGFGLVTSYQSRPITFQVPSPGPAGSRVYAVDDQVNGSFLWALGVTKRLELDVVLPVTFGQGGSGLAPITGTTHALQDTAVRDLRFGLAYAFVPRPRVLPDSKASAVWSLTGRFEVSAPTGDRDQFAGDRGAVVVPSLAADYRRGRYFAGVEVGARIRQTTALLGAQVGSQAVLALGLGMDVLPNELLALGLEAQALPTFAAQHDGAGNAAHALVPAEWALSARTAPLMGGDLGVQLGGGGGLPLAGDEGLTTPRFRFTLAIRYAPLGRDTDGDGILDADDRCPRDAGQRPFGCPATEPGGNGAAGSPCDPNTAPVGVDPVGGVCGASHGPSFENTEPPPPAGLPPMPAPSGRDPAKPAPEMPPP